MRAFFYHFFECTLKDNLTANTEWCRFIINTLSETRILDMHLRRRESPIFSNRSLPEFQTAAVKRHFTAACSMSTYFREVEGVDIFFIVKKVLKVLS